MAITLIKMDNGFFTSVDSPYISEVSPTRVLANGWDCTICSDGSVVCEAAHDYADGTHSIRYVINNQGFAHLTLKVPNQPVKTIRKGYVIPKGEKLSQGTIGLSGGNIDLRYAYFRNIDCQTFLNRFGITSVVHENPNRRYTVRNEFKVCSKCHSSLSSDGTLSEVSYQFNENGTSTLFDEEFLYDVSGATWVIQTYYNQQAAVYDYSRILYTQVQKVTDLESSLLANPKIANYVLKKDQVAKLHSFRKQAASTKDEIKKIIFRIIEIVPHVKNLLDKKESEEFFSEVSDAYHYLVSTNILDDIYGDEKFVRVYVYRLSLENNDPWHAPSVLIAEGPLG